MINDKEKAIAKDVELTQQNKILIFLKLPD